MLVTRAAAALFSILCVCMCLLLRAAASAQRTGPLQGFGALFARRRERPMQFTSDGDVYIIFLAEWCGERVTPTPHQSPQQSCSSVPACMVACWCWPCWLLPNHHPLRLPADSVGCAAAASHSLSPLFGDLPDYHSKATRTTVTYPLCRIVQHPLLTLLSR